MMEICLTKIFSIVLWYHFGFLAVSSALLGFASSGVYLALKKEREVGDAADRPIAWSAAVASVMAVASLWLVTQTSFDVYTVVQDRTIGTLAAFVLWVTLPFFFLGLVISRTLSAFPERANLLYGADLVGSALGCLAAVGLLANDMPGQSVMLIAAAGVAIGGMFFAAKRLVPLLACGVAAALALALPVWSLLDPAEDRGEVRELVEEWLPLKSPPSKPYYLIESIDERQNDLERPQLLRQNVTMKDGSVLEGIELTQPPALTPDGQGVLGVNDDGESVRIQFDRVAERKDGPGLASETVPWHDYRLWSSTSRVDSFVWPAAYEQWGLWGLSDKFAKTGASLPRQKGITIDAWAMTSMMRYSGAPLWPPGSPETDAERGRLKVLEYLPAGTVHRLFPNGAEDIVCIGAGGGLDLMTAKYFGAQNIEGVEINKGVVYSVRRAWDFVGCLYDNSVHPDVQVHIGEGRNFLERSEKLYDVVQLSGVDTYSTTEAGAFSLSENYLYTAEAFDAYLDRLKDGGVVTLTRWFYPDEAVTPAPDKPGKLEPRFSLRLLSTAREALGRKVGDAAADAGLFFLRSKLFTVILLKPAGFTAEELATLEAHCTQYGYEPLYSPAETHPTLTLPTGVYENPLQAYMDAASPTRFLEERSFDVVPTTDDRPFFFEVSKFSDIQESSFWTNPLGGLTGHGILFVLLVEVLLLGLIFVILPMRSLAREAFPKGGRVRLGVLLYFTALGFGFIVVEIILAQKFVLFLGHPIYALAVILFSMLLFSGLGSMASYKLPGSRFIAWIAPLLAGGLAVGAAYLYPIVFERYIGEDLPVRVGIAVGIIAPIGFIMGIPFPCGLRVLNRVRPRLISWAWAINGYTSVVGSVGAVILAMEFGFENVLYGAAAVYAVGVLGYALMSVRTPPAAAADEAHEAAAVVEG